MVIGSTGMGKTTMLENISRRLNGKIIVLDPLGDLIKIMVDKDSVYISPLFRKIHEEYYAIKMNLLDYGNNDKEMKIIALGESMKMLFSRDPDYSKGTWGPRLDLIFSIVTKIVMKEIENATLDDILDFLLDYKLRNSLVKDQRLRKFFSMLYKTNYDEYIQSTVNKILPVIENPYIKNFISSKEKTFSFFNNENRKILIYLAKPELGEALSRMLGSALLLMIWNSIIFGKREKVNLIIDEIKDFSPYFLPSLFSESRKFNMNIIIATQYLKQLGNDLLNSVLGNIKNIVSFRISPDDSKIIAERISYRNKEKIINTLTILPEHNALCLFNDSIFLTRTEFKNNENFDEIIERSYILYGSPVDFNYDNVLFIINSLNEREIDATFENILREYMQFSHGKFEDLERSLKILLKNGFVDYDGNVYSITKKGYDSMNFVSKVSWESAYHKYLIDRIEIFFKAMNVKFFRENGSWKNGPDGKIYLFNKEYSIEAEYGDIKNPGKIVEHLINNKRTIFVTYRSLAKKLFRIICMPAKVYDDGNIELYKNNGKAVDYKKAGDYFERVWIFTVPDPGLQGSIKEFLPKGERDVNIENLRKSDLFKIDEDLWQKFKNNLFIIENGKLIKRCDFLK